jgi:hypothetical protein
MNVLHYTVRPHPEVVGRRLDDSFVLVHLGTNHVMELNPSGARIWQLIEAGESLGRIAHTLSEEFSIASELSMEEQVIEFVKRLQRENLVQLRDSVPPV